MVAAFRKTEIKTDVDLGSALTEILATESGKALELLRETIWGLRSEFDPASITMSSTNIPDAMIKLSSVLTETSEASHKVFDLVDGQGKIIRKGEQYLGELEELAQQPQVDSEAVLKFVSKYRTLNTGLHTLSHDIILSQEFQDLCGQRIKKVMKLVCDVECYVRALLQQLNIDLPTAKSAAELDADKGIDQDVTDSLLKELGL